MPSKLNIPKKKLKKYYLGEKLYTQRLYPYIFNNICSDMYSMCKPSLNKFDLVLIKPVLLLSSLMCSFFYREPEMILMMFNAKKNKRVSSLLLPVWYCFQSLFYFFGVDIKEAYKKETKNLFFCSFYHASVLKKH